jgi:hypothetical protein
MWPHPADEKASNFNTKHTPKDACFCVGVVVVAKLFDAAECNTALDLSKGLPSGIEDYYKQNFQRIQVKLDLAPPSKGLGRNAFKRIVVSSVLPTLLAAFEPPPIAMVEVAVCSDQVRPNLLLARFARLATRTTNQITVHSSSVCIVRHPLIGIVFNHMQIGWLGFSRAH